MNSRAAFLIGIASIIIAYFYGLAVGIYKADKGAMRKIALATFAVIVLSGPITDLALSMVIVRRFRTDVSATELVSETIKVFQNKKVIQSYRLDAVGNRSVWDEYYVDSLSWLDCVT